jgi:hypothetical protein
MDPVKKFHGYRYQRGGGLGNILGGLVKTIMQPWVISGAKKVLPHVTRFGANVLSDVAEGGKLKDSLQQRGIEAGGNVLNEIVKSTSRSGRKKRLRRKTIQRGGGQSRPIFLRDRRKSHMRKKGRRKVFNGKRKEKKKPRRGKRHSKIRTTKSRKRRIKQKTRSFNDIFN